MALAKEERMKAALVSLGYEPIKSISRGTYGYVFLCKQSQKDVAVKVMERSRGMEEYIAREVYIHSLLHHPHIVEFLKAFKTKDYFCIAMEYVKGCSMISFMSKKGTCSVLSEPNAKYIFQQMVASVHYCHNRGVCNRDIKLNNFLVEAFKFNGGSRYFIKLCDFGGGKILGQDMSKPNSLVGSPDHLPPEMVYQLQSTQSLNWGIPIKPYVGQQVDIWQLGVCLFRMLFGRFPLKDMTTPEAKELMTEGTCSRLQIPREQVLNSQETVDVTDDVRDLLSKLLQGNPNDRITAREALTHRWMFCKEVKCALEQNDAAKYTNIEAMISENNLNTFKAVRSFVSH